MKNDIAVIGLSVMGRNLALNMADHDFLVSVYNRSRASTEELISTQPHKNIEAYFSLEELAGSLKAPRKFFLMVKAGAAVDELIENLLPLLDKGDIIIDGGNSYFKDTQRRYNYLLEKGIHYFGVGVSGGEEGARRGPAIMPGGDGKAYEAIRPILEGISAKVGDVPCCSYTSTGGAGHYVKMVHNGIEYADMQLISESYLALKHLGSFSNEDLSATFSKWNESELESYLISITANIFKAKEGDKHLVDLILDRAKGKGTGKWTSMEALELGVDISVISSALNARYLSDMKEERVAAEAHFGKKNYPVYSDKTELEKLVKDSLYLAKIASYAQGFSLLRAAATEYGWEFNYSYITKIFRGGCIIQAKLLAYIIEAYSKDNDLSNLLLSDYFGSVVKERQSSLRKLICLSVEAGLAVPALSSALNYLDYYTSARLGANLIQAQRDYFGAHTFERIDKEGSFHYNWVAEYGK